MIRSASTTALWLAAAFLPSALSQNVLKLPNPEKARIHYSFAVRSGQEPFQFLVELDKNSTVTGVAVVRQRDSSPFQTLPACEGGLKLELTEYDEQLDLLKHADLNFDGFEEIELLQYYSLHLGKSIYCIYKSDQKRGSFLPAPEIPNINPVAHPQSRTITVHEDWQGGPYADHTYRWNRAKVKLIEENGRLYGSDNPKCGFTDFYSRLRNGKMITTAERASACDDQPDLPLVCPAARLKRQ